jgi:hypothetical protein
MVTGNATGSITEAGATWPELCCFDADTGALEWQVPVDPLDAFPDITPVQCKAATASIHICSDDYLYCIGNKP